MTGKPDPETLHRERLGAFILRARRVEEHSLAQDKALVVEVADVTMKLVVERDRTVVRTVLPTSEEQVESAAARVRPLVLNGELSRGLNAVNALAYLIRDRPEFTDGELGEQVRLLREGWKRVDESSTASAPYAVHLGDETGRESNTSSELGWAFIYGDVVHSSQDRRDSTRMAGVRERYRAGAILVCQIIIQAISTLNVIRRLRRDGLIELPEELFTEHVVIGEDPFENEVEVWSAPADPASPPRFPQSVDDPIDPAFQQVTFEGIKSVLDDVKRRAQAEYSEDFTDGLDELPQVVREFMAGERAFWRQVRGDDGPQPER